MFKLIHIKVKSRETFLKCVMWACITLVVPTSLHAMAQLRPCCLWKHVKNTLIRGMQEAYCVNVPLLDALNRKEDLIQFYINKVLILYWNKTNPVMLHSVKSVWRELSYAKVQSTLMYIQRNHDVKVHRYTYRYLSVSPLTSFNVLLPIMK